MAFIRTVRVNGNCTKQEGYNGYNSDGVYGFIGTSPAYPCDNNPWSRNSGGLIKIKGNQLKAAKSVRYAPVVVLTDAPRKMTPCARLP